MKNLPVRVPEAALADFRSVFIPTNAPADSYLELSIRIADEDLTIRDLSAFLNFVDGIYGRLSDKGLRSYARREHGHLKITKFQKGSWELLLQEVVTSGYSHALIIILIAVKYLPPAVESMANTFNQIEQGRLARENRRRIREEMKQDKELSNLSRERRNQLSILITYLYEKEEDRIRRAIRFVQNRLIDITVRIKSKDD